MICYVITQIDQTWRDYEFLQCSIKWDSEIGWERQDNDTFENLYCCNICLMKYGGVIHFAADQLIMCVLIYK